MLRSDTIVRDDSTEAQERRAEILLVDDQEKNLQLLANSLYSQGYDVTFASSGEQALELVRNTPPDLILLDVMMPDLDGYEVCRRLKADPTSADIPVIFVTARTAGEDILKGFECGGQDYITKPLKSMELLARVRTHLELNRTRRELAASNRDLSELIDNQKRFFSILSHDLRGPVATVESLLADLRESIRLEEFDQDEFAEVLAESQQSINRVSRLANDVLEWARVQMHAIAYEPQDFVLADHLFGLLEALRPMADAKTIRLEPKLADGLFVHADIDMVSAIVRNLVGNAIKFTPRGGQITVLSRQDEETVCVEIVDTGVGMDEETAAGLFTDAQVKSRRGTEREEGSGLGLSMSRSLVERHGGKIEVSSKLGVGTTVRFTLPVADTLL